MISCGCLFSGSGLWVMVDVDFWLCWEFGMAVCVCGC